jgi:hypothetical protein
LPPGEIRLGDFRVHGADGARAEITIVPLPGLAGREVDNVNRWRGQVGLGPITEEQLVAQSEPVEISDRSSCLYDMAGASADGAETRILAVIRRRGETAWFFKMIGDDALVQSGKFALAGNTEVTVSAFPGDVGGTLANVNRWRGQLGCAPVEAAELPKFITSLDLRGAAATLVDITSENKQKRMMAIIAPRDGQTWFFKLLGDEPAVTDAKDAFVQFVKSVN